jgi:hypothetical protein
MSIRPRNKEIEDDVLLEVVLEYDFCDAILGKVRGLKSEEKQRMALWFGKRVDAILMQHPHAVLDFNRLESDILKNGVFKSCWANVEEAKKWVEKLLSRYVEIYEPVPPVVVRVNVPEARFPPEI